MIGLLQRVSHAQVAIDDEVVGRIGPGLLVLVAVQPDDGEPPTKTAGGRLNPDWAETLQGWIPAASVAHSTA